MAPLTRFFIDQESKRAFITYLPMVCINYELLSRWFPRGFDSSLSIQYSDVFPVAAASMRMASKIFKSPRVLAAVLEQMN